MTSRRLPVAGKVYGVGLGPGDPELMTLKAARLIKGADIVAYPALEGRESFARFIAAAHLKPGVREVRFDVPMVTARAPAQQAYDHAAHEIATCLEQGENVVVLCEGDPLFYGSFMYLSARLSARFEVEVVPGVTSVSAGASAQGLALASRNEVMSVLPAPLENEALRAGLLQADSVAIIKLGRHFGRVRALLGDMGLTRSATYLERVSLGVEKSAPLAEAPENAPYFSMILVTKGGDPWLQTRS